ncbi:uncharacterized protein LOC136006778 [Lathamus discolor]|uniref:uncharacterized protein LOC136006778 n=1 Tax=Lathamus discolor TaxID=678569 RepID=UPI0032B7B33B
MAPCLECRHLLPVNAPTCIGWESATAAQVHPQTNICIKTPGPAAFPKVELDVCNKGAPMYTMEPKAALEETKQGSQGQQTSTRERRARPRNSTEPFSRGAGRRQLPHGAQATGGGGKSSSSGGSRLGASEPVPPVETGAWNETACSLPAAPLTSGQCQSDSSQPWAAPCACRFYRCREAELSSGDTKLPSRREPSSVMLSMEPAPPLPLREPREVQQKELLAADGAAVGGPLAVALQVPAGGHGLAAAACCG